MFDLQHNEPVGAKINKHHLLFCQIDSFAEAFQDLLACRNATLHRLGGNRLQKKGS